MNNEKTIKSIFGLKTYYRETWEDERSEESAFIDAFLNGPYHEEEAVFRFIAPDLSKEKLVDIAYHILREIMAGNLEYREGEKLKKVMDFYEFVYRWYNGHLKSISAVEEGIKNIKEVILDCIKDGDDWTEVIIEFQMFHIGIASKVGVHSHAISSDLDFYK